MSQLGWIDFSSDERNKVKQVLAALNEPGTLDELGIGQIRDAFANRLFPGISTIQTRAKYFITTARLLRDLQTGKYKKNKSPALWFERQEHLLAEQLLVASIRDTGVVAPGIIGAESIAQGGVSRRPSSIYWNGLKTFGIVNTALSLKEFCNQLAEDSYSPHVTNHDHSEGVDDDDVERNLIDLPNKDELWQADENIGIQLTSTEATFLRDKLLTVVAIEHSVPAQILKVGGIASLVQGSNKKKTKSIKPVELVTFGFDEMTELLLKNSKISSECKTQLKQAQAFSLAMEGPHLCYNWLLAENNDLVDFSNQLKQEFSDWKELVQQQNIFHGQCAENWFSSITGSRINNKSRAFIEDWCSLMKQGASIERLKMLVMSRAKVNKGARSLLNKSRNSETWAGLRRLDYRWPVARRLLMDIEDGLRGNL